jgi:hypothetical protein
MRWGIQILSLEGDLFMTCMGPTYLMQMTCVGCKSVFVHIKPTSRKPYETKKSIFFNPHQKNETREPT